MKCIQCGKEFESKRVTSKYCSASCRVKASRVSVTNDIITRDVSVTDELSVTDAEPCVTVSVTGGCCQFLGANIHKDRDHHQSLIYDVSEEGFKRRNKAWDSMSDRYKAEIRAGAIRRKAERIEQVKAVTERRQAIKYQVAE